MLLQAEQDELASQEQQLISMAEEKDKDENEQTRLNLSKLLEMNTPKRDTTSPSKDAVPQSSMDEQLQNMQAELDRVHRLR